MIAPNNCKKKKMQVIMYADKFIDGEIVSSNNINFEQPLLLNITPD